MPEPLLILGAAIRSQREKLGLSQETLAVRCGFDRTYISMLERGKRNPSLLNLMKLATGLETSVSQLTEVYDGTDSTRSRARPSNPGRNARPKSRP
ncbi:MAG: helix-turn-helix domain-containing protein [Planctomycetaceae bacterium]